MMKLGLFVQGGGHHVAAWRHPLTPRGATQSFAHYIDIARIAEAACFDMIFLADTVATFGPDDIDVWKRGHAASRLEPLTLLSALAAITKNIGLVATASSSFNEPYNVARFFASLDKISGGRAGWNLVTSASDAEPFNYGREKHDPPALRYARAEEFADVVTGLWRTWEDDAFVEDKQAGLYFDAAKMHMLNHAGEFYRVRGPLTVRRSPQGHPLVVQAGQSEAGRALAARTAEVVFTVQQNIDDARAFRDDLRARARAFGRDPDSIKIMPGVVPLTAASREDALAEFETLQSLIHPEQGVRVLSEMTGIDLSQYPVDGPMPDAPPHGRQQGRQQVILDMAKREGLTIRQVYQRAVGARGHRLVFGDAQAIADDLQRWFEAGAADGFNIMPPTFPLYLQRFADGVVPLLRARGLFRKSYEGATLRENLGLGFPHHPAAKSIAAK
ncbi:MAG: LLM class flavin-dependent oxidoreductase [Alphaproteobacteria bacterium]|nr:LLM class flavin-dependent oxidoreductase [Alphaproteobacteria bacterium]